MTEIVRTVDGARRALARDRAEHGRIGLVPTMGAFHEGHLSLMRAARAECDTVVVSLFVNPIQFGGAEDLAAYPRDEAHDAELAAGVGVDLIFAPPVSEMFPEGFSTSVAVEGGLTERLEGDVRHRGQSHFRGVTTVVAKLFNIVSPDIAYFGQKDAQQSLVIRKMVRDLEIPVTIRVMPTVREPDGLAMSSRNARLDAARRERAAAIPAALEAARNAIAAGAATAAEALAPAWRTLRGAGVDVEYLELVSADDLSRLDAPCERAIVAVAARVGNARLIDNIALEPEGSITDESGDTENEGELACSGR